MSGPAGAAVFAGILADAGLKATVPLALAWAATRAWRRASAAQRHAVWAAAFAALPALPFLAAERAPAVALDAPWVVAVWAVGFALAVTPVVRGLLALERLRRSARWEPGGGGLAYSDVVGGPITFGLLRPVVLLPEEARGWSADHRAAAIAHERAHVERRDWAVRVVADVVSAGFWFHPLAWLARRELAREAEHAADDAVLAAGARPSDYATLLVALARSTTPQGALGVGSSLVGSRVHALLDARSRSARRWPAWGGALLLAVAVLPALGGWAAWATPEAELTCRPAGAP